MYSPGIQLPSVRELAGELAINANTVARAYSILESEGIILRRQGAGTFVTENPEPGLDLAALEGRMEQLFIEAYHLQVKPDQLRSLFELALKTWELQKEE